MNNRKIVLKSPTQEQIQQILRQKRLQKLLQEAQQRQKLEQEQLEQTVVQKMMESQKEEVAEEIMSEIKSEIKSETVEENKIEKEEVDEKEQKIIEEKQTRRTQFNQVEPEVWPKVPKKKYPQVLSSLELFVDDDLILTKKNVEREIHSPTDREIVITFDKPWEGNVSAYWTILEDDDRHRLYYRGAEYNPVSGENNGYKVCYAESFDRGLSWTKPSLGLFEYEGSTENNIIWTDIRGSENFTPFKDTRPGVPEEERYKAVGFRMYHYKLYGFVSADGINWKFIRPDPLLTFYHGKFDSQNIVFWNPEIQHYMMFFRSYLDKDNNIGRGIKIALSRDFLRWKEFRWLTYNDNYPQENMQLYTNCISRYYRSPKYLIGFPNRFAESRHGYPGHPIGGVFDAIFMTSRNGFNWTRYQEGMIRPGPSKQKWATRNNLVAWGMIETLSQLPESAPEISILVSEGYFLKKCSLRRYTFRLDGFASMRAPYSGGELVTKPFVALGNRLRVNFETSAMGGLRIEIQDKFGNPISPYLAKNCYEMYGDEIGRVVRWSTVNKLVMNYISGKPIRLRFVMRDCHLYSFQFFTPRSSRVF